MATHREYWTMARVLVGVAVVAGGCERLDDVLKDIEEQGHHGGDGGDSGGPGPVQLIAPLSASIATSQRPLFHWTGGTLAAKVDICADRACDQMLASFMGKRGSAQPPTALAPGMVFWRVTAGNVTSPTWELKVPAHDSGRLASWGAIPDFNGDGYADLVVGQKSLNQIQIFLGGPQGPATTPSATLTGTAGFGDTVAPAGDLDGDGFCDLAVWVSGPPQMVVVYRGGPTFPSTSVAFAAPAANPLSQMGVMTAGDVNEDGYGDLLVGGNSAQLFLGGPNGVSTTASQTLAPASGTPDASLVMAGGDATGDGHVDALIGGVGSNQYDFHQGNGQTLVAPSAPLSLGGTFGALAGDVNGDGLIDFAAYEIDVGSPTGPTFFESIAGEFFYQAAGDVNGDGYSDVLVQVSSLVGVPESERASFGGPMPCSANSCTNFVPLLVPGHQNDGNPEQVVISGGVGDLNGDGYDDVAYGAPGAGAAYVFYGSPSGPPATPSLTITQAQGFGFSLARL